MKLLDTYISIPLEREYEAWIVCEIESYFKAIGIVCDIWAISPKLEKTWPADEKFGFDGKVIGLQFKRPKLANLKKKNPIVSYDRLRWSLSTPKGQFQVILGTSDIYYCLPTFINREYRSNALDHCLFWHPNSKPKSFEFWYDNSSIKTSITNQLMSKSPDVMRWGHFVEQFSSCKIGTRVKAGNSISNYLAPIQRNIEDYANDFEQKKSSERIESLGKQGFTLYFIYIRI